MEKPAPIPQHTIDPLDNHRRKIRPRSALLVHVPGGLPDMATYLQLADDSRIVGSSSAVNPLVQFLNAGFMLIARSEGEPIISEQPGKKNI
jgi:hypothetical protein